MAHAAAVIDLAAVRHNINALKNYTSAEIMAVVKADAYGHGVIPCAKAALEGGANWLGVALLKEALQLRDAGITAPLLSWLWTPGETGLLRSAVQNDVDISIGSRWALDSVLAETRKYGRPTRIHLKIDTGLTRNGIHPREWIECVTLATIAQKEEAIEVVGIWSHLSHADQVGHRKNVEQVHDFQYAIDAAKSAGLEPPVTHLANSAAILTAPDTHFDLVRAGIAMYGFPSVPSPKDYELKPAMKLRTEVASVKEVEKGAGVSYGHDYRTTCTTKVALIPLGYADGIPRAAANRASVWINGRRFRISGRVSMDQFVIDIAGHEIDAGDEVMIFGPGDRGEPTALEWASTLNTIPNEIVTGIGPRVPRIHVDRPLAT